MKMDEIRRYGIYDATLREISSATADLEKKRNACTTKSVRDMYDRQIAQYDQRSAAIAREMLRIDSAILRITDSVDRDIMQLQKRGYTADYIASRIGYGVRTVQRRISRIKTEIADY